jgi:hypothetical protein
MNVLTPEQRLQKIENFLNQNFNQISSIGNIQNGFNIVQQQQQQIDLKLNQLEMRILTLENTINYVRKKYNLQ